MAVIRVRLYWFFTLLGAACALPALGQSKNQPKAHLEIGEYLQVNDYLVAADKKSFAVLQPDGNLCVFMGDQPKNKRGPSLWCSGSARNTGAYYAILGPDANLCVHRGAAPVANAHANPRGGGGSSIWCWGDKEFVGARYILKVEGAALCAYEVLASSGGTAQRPMRMLWASRKLTKLSGFVAH